MIGSSDSDSEDDKRVIRSAKDRRFDELQATCHEIRVSKPISDCGVLKLVCLLFLHARDHLLIFIHIRDHPATC